MERILPTPEELKHDVTQIAHAIGRVITFRGFTPEQAPDHMSEHYRQPVEDQGGWDDMGCYYDASQ